MSPTTAGWKERVTTRIFRRSDGVIAVISSNTPKADGELWEIKCAVEERKPTRGESGSRTATARSRQRWATLRLQETGPRRTWPTSSTRQRMPTSLIGQIAMPPSPAVEPPTPSSRESPTRPLPEQLSQLSPRAMRAMVQDRYGTAEVLELRTVDRPQIASTQVLIEVHAAGVDRGVATSSPAPRT